MPNKLTDKETKTVAYNLENVNNDKCEGFLYCKEGCFSIFRNLKTFGGKIVFFGNDGKKIRIPKSSLFYQEVENRIR